MKRKKTTFVALPVQVQELLKNVGANVRLARKKRGMSVQALADSVQVSRPTIANLEAGKPGVGFGVVISVLWVLRLHEDIAMLAAPERDEAGKLLDIQKHFKRKDDGSDQYDF